MIKERMRHAGDDALLKQMLDFSQLALKMIANVTYGYTSASFTGQFRFRKVF
jgi:DNA polymerase zeta